ncbi:CMP-N-acetylneuraminate-beta-galactosamide-alpha-2,3-sialyltransferase 1-like [Apostichopus japonicus]|uniref:CMP-N-acetylneuraminate-beta-galactosamide- alpha-2,3-sialyltransferase 1-like n=1 Tax=Stichopus japonicus TaxID=307972 RepID=UPI003AB7A6C4
MSCRFLKFRPLQICILAGLVVYVLLTLMDNAIFLTKTQSSNVHRGERVDPQLPVRVVSEEAKHENGQGAEGVESGETLKNIELLLGKIHQKLSESENSANVSDVIHEDIKTVKELFRQAYGSDNLAQLGDSAKFFMNGFLQEPKEAWPKPPKVQLNEMEYMRDPSYIVPECPKTIMKQTRYSKWFRERYIPDIKLFLEPSDVNDYEKYYKLSHYGLPFGLGGTPRDKFGRLVNNINYTKSFMFAEKKRPRCLRCAVIGCGGVLNGSSAGEEIDNHDLVFRLNHAHSSEQYSKDAGSKTSFYTFFPESQHIEDVVDKNVSYFYTMFKPYDVDYGINVVEDNNPPLYISKGKQYKLRKPALNNQRTRSIHPDFFRYIFTHYLDSKSHRPTTGALVVFLAIHMCDEVNIYGFGYDPRFTLHYYDKKFVAHTDKSTALHDVDNERELWNKLHEAGVIRLFKRDA